MPDVDMPGRRLAIAAVAALCGFVFAAGAALTDAPPMILVLNALAVTMTVGLLWRYLPTASAAFWRRRPSARDWLVVGSLAFAMAFFGSRLVSIAARDFGFVWIVDTDIVSLRVALSLFGTMCLLVAPRASETSLLRRWRDVAIWGGAGLVLAGLLLVMHHGHPPPLLRWPAGQGRG